MLLKGFKCAGVEGEDVVQLLKEAIGDVYKGTDHAAQILNFNHFNLMQPDACRKHFKKWPKFH